MQNNWYIKKQPDDLVRALSNEFLLPEFVIRVLINRGVDNSDKIKKFLFDDNLNLFDPFVLSSMDKAVDRINLAIKNNEKIAVYGDYDVDGITSVAIITKYLSEKGLDVVYYIPDRILEGYGINNNAIDKLKNQDVSLIISVDTGITAVDEVEYAKTLGIDVIITDHHECGQVLPDAIAVINPMIDLEKIGSIKVAGVCVAFKLICALDGDSNKIFNDYGDLLTIGTIADIMPLQGENRIIVKSGLKLLNNTKNLGLNSLLNVSQIDVKKNITTSTVGFAISPRINASGRIGDPNQTVKLFITDDNKTANDIAVNLCKINNERQKIENVIMNEAIEYIENHKLYEKYSILMLKNKNWHHGVVGIVASKLKDIYNMPTIIFSEDEHIAKGSARSIDPLNIYELLKHFENELVSFGGHKLAAGLCIKKENFESFYQKISDYIKNDLKIKEFYQQEKIDCQLSDKDLVVESVEKLFLLEPFGNGNETPVFCYKNAVITSISPISDDRHLKLNFRCANKNIVAFLFSKKINSFEYRVGDIVDISFNLSINDYNNIKSVQFIIKDICPCEDEFNKAQKLLNTYYSKSYDKIDLPSRNEVACVYKYILNKNRQDINTHNIVNLSNNISKDMGIFFDQLKLMLSLEILNELGVVESKINKNKVNILNINSKISVNLFDASVYKRFESQDK